MTNREIGFELEKIVREERKITNQVLRMINLALESRAYLDHGFATMFEWLVKGFNYSNAAAYRRIEAARLIKAVPEATQKLESGQVSLTSLSKAQSAIKAQEKSTASKLSAKDKSKIVEEIEGKSSLEAEKILCSLLPEAALTVRQEKKTIVDETTTRYALNFSNEMVADLQRAKEVLSHKFPNASDGEIIAYALKFLLNKTDPLRRTSAAEAKRVTKVGAKRITIKAANASCTYQDPLTGRVCGSRHQIQIDHVVPKAMGGGDEPENLRALCRQHNLHAAEKIFGKEHMNRFRRQD